MEKNIFKLKLRRLKNKKVVWVGKGVRCSGGVGYRVVRLRQGWGRIGSGLWSGVGLDGSGTLWNGAAAPGPPDPTTVACCAPQVHLEEVFYRLLFRLLIGLSV